MKATRCTIWVLLTATAVCIAEMQTWTFEKNGKTIEGEVVGFTGESVNLRRPDGQTVSVPIAYLTASNRTELAAQRAAVWKDVEVRGLEGTVSAGGRYKKCRVTGKGVPGTILVEFFPSSVESILNKQAQEAAGIARQAAGIEERQRGVERLEASLPKETAVDAPYLDLLNSNYAELNRRRLLLADAKAKLAQLQAVHSQNLTNTVAARTIKVKNTGLVYDGLQVWRCPDTRGPER